MTQQKTAVVAIIGKPNTGKSTLMNTVLGQKISIVTHKVQTTRTIMRGIATIGSAQLIFLDTPGIFEAKRGFERNMVRSAWSSIAGADLILLMVDAKSRDPLDEDFHKIATRLLQQRLPVVFVVNKTDIQDLDDKLFAQYHDTTATRPNVIFHISALHNQGVDQLIQYLIAHSPNMPWLYDEEEVTTAPMRFLASEITREQIFLQLHEELPYNMMVDTESWTEMENGDVKIHQTIIVATKSHKQMVLGKQGSMIKSISQAARNEINATLAITAHLYVFVKIREDWMEKATLNPHSII